MRVLLLVLAGLICACGASVSAAPAQDGCATGYELTGDLCALTLPAHAMRNPAGDWTCEHGTYDADGQCLPVAVPEHASLSANGHTWVCDDGYHDAGSACAAGAEPTEAPTPCGLAPINRDGSCGRVPLPRHAHRVSNTFWLCQNGFQRMGDKCTPVHIPRFAHQSVSRDDWLCNRGYQRNAANLCVEIDVPDHATLGYYGDAWFCNRGYYELRGVCLQETDEHRAITARYGGNSERFMLPPPVVKAPAQRAVAGEEERGACCSVNYLGRYFVRAYIFGGIVTAVVATLTLFNNWRPPSTPVRHLTMAYVPRRRGSGSALAVWRSFGHRVDALTGAPIATTARVAQCRNCHAWYDAASVTALRHENEARCIACGRAAVSYNIA